MEVLIQRLVSPSLGPKSMEKVGYIDPCDSLRCTVASVITSLLSEHKGYVTPLGFEQGISQSETKDERLLRVLENRILQVRAKTHLAEALAPPQDLFHRSISLLARSQGNFKVHVFL